MMNFLEFYGAYARLSNEEGRSFDDWDISMAYKAYKAGDKRESFPELEEIAAALRQK